MIKKDMQKDEFLEEKLNSYVEGVEEPKVDLSAAKRALHEEQSRRRSVRRRMWVALASACASLLLVAVALVSVLPSLHADKNNSAGDMMNGGSAQGGDVGGDSGPSQPPSGGSTDGDSSGSSGSSGPAETEPVRYTLSKAEKTTVSAQKLAENYGRGIKKLTDLAAFSEISVTYTLYSVAGRSVLLETAISSPAGAEITVYTDLSGGSCRAAEMDEFDSLSLKTATYVYDFKVLDGKTVYLAAFTAESEYCVSALASESDFFAFMEYLTEE